ncbi:MAG TPA: RNA 2',3'-cyclic phosphodiesterase [Gammaproteobacteria bacterium]|nr:RNA 2',3'-cyclic phosphodiesterase [Gammaproteobacteria bacterium]
MNDARVTRKRLFFALWPDAEVRRQLAQAARHWSRHPVPEANLHMTLAFLGGCTEQQQDCLYRVAPGVHGEPFELQLDFLGHWERPRTRWLGTSQIPDALLQLEADLRLALEPCEVKLEERHFVPHVTLSRKEKTPHTRPGWRRSTGACRTSCWPNRFPPRTESDTMCCGAGHSFLRRNKAGTRNFPGTVYFYSSLVHTRPQSAMKPPGCDLPPTRGAGNALTLNDDSRRSLWTTTSVRRSVQHWVR